MRMTKEEIDNYERKVEQMTRNFMKRINNPQLFESFAIEISSLKHAEKWCAVYDWMHENFTFEFGEEDGKIITKFVELIEEKRL